MREKNAWFVSLGLLFALILVCGSARQYIRIPLPLAVVIGLGVPAILLFWEHRQKLVEIFRNSQS